jgi:hypothetical protein
MTWGLQRYQEKRYFYRKSCPAGSELHPFDSINNQLIYSDKSRVFS